MRKEIASDTQTRNPDILEQRLAMFRHGFLPIPCESKEGMDFGWTKARIEEALIRDWHRRRGGNKRKGTGIRLAGDIFVIDLDIKETEIINAVLDAIAVHYPEFYRNCLWRHSGGVSLALFGRVSKRSDGKILKGRKSRKFGRRQADGSFADKAQVEVWSGEAWDENYGARYFAAFGPHKVAGRFYDWDGPSPCDVPLSSLPVFDGDQVGPLLDMVESVLGQFLEPYDERRNMDGAKNEYILTPETEFRLADGGLTTVAALEAQLPPGVNSGVRGLMGFEDPKMSEGRDHCHAYVRDQKGRNFGRLAIRNFELEIMYYFTDEAPAPPFELDDAAREMIAGLLNNANQGDAETIVDRGTDHIESDVDPKTTHDNAVNWLARNVAWFTQAYNGRGGVVSVYPDGEFTKPVALAALRQRMMSYCWIEKGPRGGTHVHNPVDAWSMLPAKDKLCVSGVRMRPELPRPLFAEDGHLHVNRYQVPQHPAAGGSVEVFERHMKRLIPDPFERQWVWNWMACLVQHPEWRMVALAMVAREHGSGRGLFAETMQLVLGEKFVISLPYDSVTGNAKFNAEIEGRLLVYVNEARTADAGKHGVKTANREALRVFIEPNHRVPQRIEPKGIDAYYTRLSISTLILANSIRAVPIDEHDRRAAVVINGPQMTVAEREEYQFGWMLKAENIGALYRHLRDWPIEKNTAVFDPYMAPSFVGRDMMIDANKSTIDRAWAAAIERLKAGADLYAMSQVVALSQLIARSPHADFGDLVRAHTFEHGCRIGVKRPSEQNWRTRYGSGDDNRQPVFAFDEVSARRWTTAEPHQIKRELDKAQKVVDAPGKAFNKALRLVKAEGEEE